MYLSKRVLQPIRRSGQLAEGLRKQEFPLTQMSFETRGIWLYISVNLIYRDHNRIHLSWAREGTSGIFGLCFKCFVLSHVVSFPWPWLVFGEFVSSKRRTYLLVNAVPASGYQRLPDLPFLNSKWKILHFCKSWEDRRNNNGHHLVFSRK